MSIVGWILILCFLLPGFSGGLSQDASWRQRLPIRVGGNAQEKKLIYRVDPAYPETAKMAGIAGVVVLQATIDENGDVAGAIVLRGHPLFNNSAVQAVKQWRYQPTFLRGEPVPVIATVAVIFNPHSPPIVTLDASGNLRDPVSGLKGADLITEMKQADQAVIIKPDPKMALSDLEHALRSLQRAMKWDEEAFGCEYDLDIYMIVAVNDFNMGAMENKGLNIFNASCVLASAATATRSGRPISARPSRPF